MSRLLMATAFPNDLFGSLNSGVRIEHWVERGGGHMTLELIKSWTFTGNLDFDFPAFFLMPSQYLMLLIQVDSHLILLLQI